MNAALSDIGAGLKSPKIVIDGLFFQFARTGIARLWRSYLEQWAGTDFASHLIVLDRARSAPRIPGITYHDIPAFSGAETGREMLQIEEWCQELRADVFISTFYSNPIGTRSVMMVYDMIYELHGGGDKAGWEQEEKSLAILHASHIVAISENSAKDVRHLYPYLSGHDLSVVHCGVDPAFSPAPAHKVSAVREKYSLEKPFFLLVGSRVGFRGYKNAVFLVRTLAKMKSAAHFEVACVGGEKSLGPLGEFKNVSVRLLPHVSEEDLVALYSGAEALVYPSRYEGFGLPIIEAMACGCPVITCPNGSIPEVAGDAALFVDNDDDGNLEAALHKIGDSGVRAQLRDRGFERARHFSWKKAAEQLAEILLHAAALPEKSAREVRIWKELREKDRRLAPYAELGRKIPNKRVSLKLGGYCLQISASRV